MPSDTGSENLIIEVDGERRPTKRFAWYYAPTYLLFWVGLFFAVIYPLFQNLPTGLQLSQESDNPGKFVAERAQAQLLEISRLGPRLVGDIPNEVTVVKYLLDEIEKIRLLMREDLYEMEVEVQKVSGSYVIKGFTNHYQAVQNVLVKLSTKSSNSTNYLLVNSHYDTKPGAPGRSHIQTQV